MLPHTSGYLFFYGGAATLSGAVDALSKHCRRQRRSLILLRSRRKRIPHRTLRSSSRSLLHIPTIHPTFTVGCTLWLRAASSQANMQPFVTLLVETNKEESRRLDAACVDVARANCERIYCVDE